MCRCKGRAKIQNRCAYNFWTTAMSMEKLPLNCRNLSIDARFIPKLAY